MHICHESLTKFSANRAYDAHTLNKSGFTAGTWACYVKIIVKVIHNWVTIYDPSDLYALARTIHKSFPTLQDQVFCVYVPPSPYVHIMMI